MGNRCACNCLGSGPRGNHGADSSTTSSDSFGFTGANAGDVTYADTSSNAEWRAIGPGGIQCQPERNENLANGGGADQPT